MSRVELFWERVHAALDQRRDPLGDAEVRALLVDEPELLGELVTLRDSLQRVASSQRRRRAPRIALAAAVLACAGFATWLALEREVEQPKLLARANAAAGRVLSFEVSVTSESPELRTISRFDGQLVATSREALAPPRVLERTSPPRFIACVDSVAFTR